MGENGIRPIRVEDLKDDEPAIWYEPVFEIETEADGARIKLLAELIKNRRREILLTAGGTELIIAAVVAARYLKRENR